jgi:hypothetical protein
VLPVPFAARGRWNAPISVARHFIVAALNCGLLVLIPFVLKMGPLPDAFGAGMLTPF